MDAGPDRRGGVDVALVHPGGVKIRIGAGAEASSASGEELSKTVHLSHVEPFTVEGMFLGAAAFRLDSVWS